MEAENSPHKEVTVVIEKKDDGNYKASIEGINGLSVEGDTIVHARKKLWNSIRLIKESLFSGKPFKITEKFRYFFPKEKK